MSLRTLAALTVSTTVVCLSGLAVTTPADAAGKPTWTKNCTALNKKYPHGIGKAKAKDRTSGRPVTTFKRSTSLYKRAISWNSRLDGDRDGVACEKA